MVSPASSADEAALALVFDDDPNVAGQLSMLLETGGCKPLRADSVEEAVKILRQGNVELLFLGVELPGASGMDFLRMVKQEQPYIEVIMVSADAQIENAIAFVRAGAFDYLTKPISAKFLLEKAKAALEKRREHLEMDMAATASMIVEESPLSKYALVKTLAASNICEVSVMEHDFKNFLLMIYQPLQEISPKPEDCSAIFLRTAERMQRIKHPGIAKLVEHGFQDESAHPYVVLEAPSGSPLDEKLLSSLSLEAKLGIARQMASALAKMHESSVFIGSFQPEQIIAEDEEGGAKLLDFGLICFFALEARKLGRGLHLDCSFMAPEILEGAASPDIKSDVFSLAALMLFMLSGKRPFPADDAKLARPEMHGASPKMEKALLLLLGAMLQHDPAMRPPSDEALSSLNVICTMPDMLDNVLETYDIPANYEAWKG